jgi:hypothetical protein
MSRLYLDPPAVGRCCPDTFRILVDVDRDDLTLDHGVRITEPGTDLHRCIEAEAS